MTLLEHFQSHWMWYAGSRNVVGQICDHENLSPTDFFVDISWSLLVLFLRHHDHCHLRLDHHPGEQGSKSCQNRGKVSKIKEDNLKILETFITNIWDIWNSKFLQSYTRSIWTHEFILKFRPDTLVKSCFACFDFDSVTPKNWCRKNCCNLLAQAQISLWFRQRVKLKFVLKTEF